MANWIRTSQCLLTLTMAGLAVANDNVKQFFDNNVVLNVGMSTFERGAFVSGTKVDMQFFCSWASFPVPPDENTWDNVQVVYLRAQCDSMDQTFYPPLPPLPPNPVIQGLIRIASTNFWDANAITFYVTGKFLLEDYTPGGLGSKYVEKVWDPSVTAYNKGAAFGLSELEDEEPDGFAEGVPQAVAAFNSMRHSVIAADERDWTKNTLLDAVMPCTAFYVNSHGNQDPRFRCEDNLRAFPSDIEPVRADAFDSGLPPLYLAFVDACLAAADYSGGENHGFSLAFLYPVSTYIGIDRAQVGWRVLQDTMFTTSVCLRFWNKLAQRATVYEARDDAVMGNPLFAAEIFAGNAEPRDYMAVYGDYYTRLMGAYTGSESMAPNDWWLVL